MAIRKDLDDMLNSLMDGSGSSAGSTPARSHNTPRATRKSKFDNMSVDDLLHALEEEKQHIYDEADVPDDEPPAVWEFAPPSDDAPSSAEEDENVPNIISEVMHTEASTEVTRVFDSIPSAEELPKPVKKKKIVITGELPDYEALRREEMEREKQAQRASEAAAEEAHAAERARRAAEAAAERARLEEEARQRRLAREEAERQQLEQEEAERQRRIAQIEAEKQRRAEEAAEQARLAEEAERTRLAEEAEKARIAEEAEQARLAMEAERARLAEEAKRARIAEEAEQARLAMEAEQQRRIEEMKRLAEEAVPVNIIVSSVVKSLYLIKFRAFCCKHYYGKFPCLWITSQLFQHSKTILFRKHPVKKKQVWKLFFHCLPEFRRSLKSFSLHPRGP